jgi:hypothetical protein
MHRDHGLVQLREKQLLAHDQMVQALMIFSGSRVDTGADAILTAEAAADMKQIKLDEKGFPVATVEG